MTKTEVPCDVNGCNYVARHRNPIVVKRMIGNHKRKAHGIKGESYARNSKYRRRRLAQSSESKPSQPTVNSQSGNVDTESLLHKVMERFKFCPCCGMNLDMHLTAIIAIVKNETNQR